MIYTAYHGVAPVQEGENGQERFVYLGFRDPDFVSPETAARYSEMYPGGFADLGLIISDRVAVSALKETLGRVLNRKRKPPQR